MQIMRRIADQRDMLRFHTDMACKALHHAGPRFRAMSAILSDNKIEMRQ